MCIEEQLCCMPLGITFLVNTPDIAPCVLREQLCCIPLVITLLVNTPLVITPVAINPVYITSFTIQTKPI